MPTTPGRSDSVPLTPYVEYLHSVYGVVDDPWDKSEKWLDKFDEPEINSPVFIADDVNGELSFSTFTSERDFCAGGPFHSEINARPDNITTRLICVADGEVRLFDCRIC